MEHPSNGMPSDVSVSQTDIEEHWIEGKKGRDQPRE